MMLDLKLIFSKGALSRNWYVSCKRCRGTCQDE